jgi:hypothetical protein
MVILLQVGSVEPEVMKLHSMVIFKDPMRISIEE